MSKPDKDKQRLEHNDTGDHLGGTKFGQTPGTTGPNHAKPDKGQKDKQERSDDR